MKVFVFLHYCKTLNFRDTTISRICNFFYCILLHRESPQLPASFQILKIGPLLRKLWPFKVDNVSPYPPYPHPSRHFHLMQIKHCTVCSCCAFECTIEKLYCKVYQLIMCCEDVSNVEDETSLKQTAPSLSGRGSVNRRRT